MRWPARRLAAASEEIHGHSFRTEVTVRGTPDPATGMVLDLGLLEHRIGGSAEDARSQAPQPDRGAGTADAGEPVALHLGTGAACRRGHARHRPSRQLQRELHLLRTASVRITFTVIASEASASRSNPIASRCGTDAIALVAPRNDALGIWKCTWTCPSSKTAKPAREAGSRRCATTSARPSSGWRTRRPPRSIPATPAASCARPGSAPTIAASRAAAA